MTIEINLSAKEISALDALGVDLDISNRGVIIMAIRWFQLFHLGVYNFVPNPNYTGNQTNKMEIY